MKQILIIGNATLLTFGIRGYDAIEAVIIRPIWRPKK